jgi:pyruvate-formate lyase-activating enzyme
VEEIIKIVEFLSSLKNIQHYHLMPYHGLGNVKYETLGREPVPFETPSAEHMQLLNETAAKYVNIHGGHKNG